MRIAHVTATFPPYRGGTGHVAYHQARVLHDRGHQVTVFTAAAAGAGDPARGLAATGPAAEGAAEGLVAERSTAEGRADPFEVRRLRASFRLGNAPFTPGLVAGLAGFDVVHLHLPYIFGAELVLAAKLRHGFVLVVTYHNRLGETHVVKRALFGAYNAVVEPVVLGAATKLIAVRREHFVHALPGRAGSPRLVEVPNGVDVDTFAPRDGATSRRELGLPAAAPVALFVGALDQAHRFKNVGGLLRAFAMLARDLPDAVLLVVGDGDMRPSLEREARELGVAGRTRFLGSLAPEALPRVYSAATLTVLPSSAVESFGLVLLESFACGTPVVASDLPGVREQVRPGVDGLLVPPGDGPALARALAELLAAPDRAARLGEAGRRKVEAGYTWRAIGERLERVYLEAAAGRPVRRWA